jgi:hypothetical protein
MTNIRVTLSGDHAGQTPDKPDRIAKKTGGTVGQQGNTGLMDSIT